MKNEGKENKQTSSKHSLQGTQDKENRTERFVFISNSALVIDILISQWPQFSIMASLANNRIVQNIHIKTLRKIVAKQNENVKEKQYKIDRCKTKRRQTNRHHQNIAWLNPVQPNISMYFPHTLLFTFPMVLETRICLTLKSLLNWW